MDSIASQLQAKGITDEKVLKAFQNVDRSRFVQSEDPYADKAQPIGHGQTISQPYIIALMLQELTIKQEDNILEVGTGSGYVVALLSTLCRTIVSTEVIQALVEKAQHTLAALEEEGQINGNYEITQSERGAPEQGPYDKILVSAAAPEIPQYLADQLKDGGVMVLPVGREEQWLVRCEKRGETLIKEQLAPVRFVPLL